MRVRAPGRVDPWNRDEKLGPLSVLHSPPCFHNLPQLLLQSNPLNPTPS
jgi:hypothetical protein